MDTPDEHRGTAPAPNTDQPPVEHPADRLMRAVRVLLFVGIGAALGFSSGGTIYRLARADDQPPTDVEFLRHAVRLGLIAGAFMGAVVGLALVPGLEENVRRALSKRGLILTATGGFCGAVLCVGAAVLYWGIWVGLSGFGAQPPSHAAKYAGGVAGGLLMLVLMGGAARWLRRGVPV